MPQVKIDTTQMPEFRRRELGIATLRAVERFFQQPGVEEDYQKWLVEYRKTHPVTECESA